MVIINEQLVSSDKVLDVYTRGARFEPGLDTDYSDAFHAFLMFAHENDSTVPYIRHLFSSTTFSSSSSNNHPNIPHYKAALDAKTT